MSRPVKCYYCGESFDRDVTEFVTVKNRYAHAQCHSKHCEKIESAKLVTQAARDDNKEEYREIMDFAKAKFGGKANYALIQKQIKTYISENGYTYTGILKALIYYYDVLKNSTAKTNGGIGIVPFVYEQAKTHYYHLWLANKANEGREVTNECDLVTITPPTLVSRKRPLFTFLDGGDKNGK